MKKRIENKIAKIDAAKLAGIVTDHLNACKKAFSIACKEMMHIVSVIAPDSPAAVPPEPATAKPVQRRRRSRKATERDVQQICAMPELYDAVKRAGTAKITRSEADNAKPNAVRRRRARKAAPEKPVVQDSSARPTTHHRTPASVRLTPHEITLNIGGFPVRELAENDAKDFLNNPKIFWYRGTQFPDPKRYSVQPHIECAKVIKRTDPKFTRAPYTVSVTIGIDGDDKRAESWGTGVFTKNKSEQE